MSSLGERAMSLVSTWTANYLGLSMMFVCLLQIAITVWYQDLSYGEILAGQPGAWLVKKNVLYACNHKNLKRTSY